jgi:hypothetical protein
MIKPIIHHVPLVEDRRELDSIVREIYDTHSTAGERLSRESYDMLIQGGANAVHRFGETFVPRTNDGKIHAITSPKGQFA